MTGAEAVLQTAAAAGVEVCFANPGTTEMALVHALDRAPQVRAVLGLFEGVCSGAADGFARMSGCPALTLLHLGAGLSNALANLHNARRVSFPRVRLRRRPGGASARGGCLRAAAAGPDCRGSIGFPTSPNGWPRSSKVSGRRGSPRLPSPRLSSAIPGFRVG